MEVLMKANVIIEKEVIITRNTATKITIETLKHLWGWDKDHFIDDEGNIYDYTHIGGHNNEYEKNIVKEKEQVTDIDKAVILILKNL